MAILKCVAKLTLDIVWNTTCFVPGDHYLQGSSSKGNIFCFISVTAKSGGSHINKNVCQE